jgi:hypothetical protein
MNRERQLRRRVKWLTWFFIVGLLISGVTAQPLRKEMNLATKWFGIADQTSASATGEIARWLLIVRDALNDVASKNPFLFYGTDWLAFGHYMIALAFVGALRDPVRNRWLFDFGLIACVLVIPFAFACGAVRGIPVWWRLIDCSFGVIGFVPLWFCRKWSGELENNFVPESSTS